ncbi:MAG: hypothetical protein A4E52_01215 [Pelotomaculum sp. PtaB.Bin013]|uniref:Uncharacterized protein n=1 Tax=Pelotomaculum isophthalicicum JI TaxID=947010 RepID=A0A9X4GXW0_9FIRM|nr:hypothetical protein [Pelotomaculum isophthalicicum]MDF9407220.1 hypothetical protein [Pelotomaculum isophthalicicum JI]OPX88441.1 MAG: hypothetical protein A4E52_01215 [Pelotomaculum sp. PtaB.Bin013]
MSRYGDKNKYKGNVVRKPATTITPDYDFSTKKNNNDEDTDTKENQ